MYTVIQGVFMKKSTFLVLISLLFSQLVFANQFRYKNIIYDQFDNKITLLKYRGTDAEVSIPKALNKVPVTKLEKRAFAENNYIEEITLPSTISTISEEAFANCENLTTIYYYADELTIEKNAFLNCKPITLIPLTASKKSPSLTEIEPKIAPELPSPNTDPDPLITELRKEYIDTSSTFARILEKAITHYDAETDDLPIEYVTEIYTYLDVFINSADTFHSAVGEKYGVDEIESARPEYIDLWMPEEEMLSLFSYLNRIDTVMINMGLNTPNNAFEQTARLYYNNQN